MSELGRDGPSQRCLPLSVGMDPLGGDGPFKVTLSVGTDPFGREGPFRRGGRTDPLSGDSLSR